MIAVTFLFTLAISCTIIVPYFVKYIFLKLLYYQITYTLYVVCFLVCLTYNCYMYVRILQALKQRQGTDRALQLSPEFERNIQQMAIMVIANGVTFFIFSSIVAAYFVTSLLNLFKEKLPQQLYYDVMIFENFRDTSILLNASANPPIYFISNRRYRGALRTSIMSLSCKSGNKPINLTRKASGFFLIM